MSADRSSSPPDLRSSLRATTSCGRPVWATDHLIASTVAWATAGFLATAVYLVLGAGQTALAARRPPAGAER